MGEGVIDPEDSILNELGGPPAVSFHKSRRRSKTKWSWKMWGILAEMNMAALFLFF